MKVRGEGNIVGLSWISIAVMLTGVYIHGESKGKQVSSTWLVLGIVRYREGVSINVRRRGWTIPCTAKRHLERYAGDDGLFRNSS